MQEFQHADSLRVGQLIQNNAESWHEVKKVEIKLHHSILLISNRMIFLVHFGINKYS